jgi:hypothetical protein
MVVADHEHDGTWIPRSHVSLEGFCAPAANMVVTHREIPLARGRIIV